MNQLIATPPRTIMQVFKMLPEGTLAEVIDNELFMSPAPTPFHQRIITSLLTDLNYFVRSNSLGEVFSAPVDLYLDEESNAVQPDILFISNSNPLIIDQEGLHGVPDLIIEILSPGNKKHDQVTKKALYERFGVKEYWIVDPENKVSNGFRLHNNSYQPIGQLTNKISIQLFEKEFTY